MFKRIKPIVCIAAVALLAIAPAVHAGELEGSKPSTVLAGTTNVVPVLSTNGFYTVDVPKAKDVALACNFKYHAAPSAGDVNGIRIDIYRGIDAGVFETNVWATWQVVAGSTTVANLQITNFTLPSVPYLRFRTANVSTNAIATNFLFTYTFKN